LTTTFAYGGRMAVRGRALESGAAFVTKGEPSASEVAHLQHRLDDERRKELTEIVARGISAGFTAEASADQTG
jgi:hypothetical protein